MTQGKNGPPDDREEISRRRFVSLSALAAGGAVLGACGDSPTDASDPIDQTDPPDPTATVSAVRGTDLPAMARQVLDPLGGIETVVHAGESVFIKPNMVTLPWAEYGNSFSGGECTKPEIVVAVAEECLKAGASEVVVGDGSHAVELPWHYARTLDGSANLAAEMIRLSAEYGRPARVASLEADSPEWVEVPSSTYLGTILVSSLVAHADRVISIPVAKTHSWAQLTLALKNFIGVAPLWRYGDLPNGIPDRGVVFDHSTPRAISAIFLDMVAGVQPDLAIVDFSIGIEGNGPNLGHGGRTVDMRSRLGSYLLLASTDLVAADATAARIMNHNPSGIAQLTMGYERGMGEIREEYIEIVGHSLESLRVPWARAQVGGQQLAASGRRAPYPCPGRMANA
jgi:uncharacterized protein (DUF362 family)